MSEPLPVSGIVASRPTFPLNTPGDRCSRRRVGPSWLRLSLLLTLVFSLGLGGGCSRKPAEVPADLQPLHNLVYNISDTALNPGKFQKLFTDGAAPEDAQRKEYNKYVFKLASDPEVTGDAAKLAVLVCTMDAERPVTWQAVRESGTWKLQSAPLQ